MKARLILIAAVATLTLAATSDRPVSTVGFRDFTLGMTLQEFMARPPMKDGTEVVCTNSIPSDWDIVTAEEVEIGVIACMYSYQFKPHLRDSRGRSQWEREVPLSPSVHAFVRFFFYQRKLYQVKLVANPRDLQDLESALVEKWGKPTRMIVGKYPVKSGFLDVAVIEGFEKHWVKASSVVSLAFPDVLERKIGVTYLDLAAVKQINMKIRAMRPPEADKLKL